MHRCTLAIAGIAAATLASSASAQSFPLPATTGDRTALEGTAPFLIPSDFSQTLIVDRDTLTPKGLPASFGNWDMSAFSRDSRFVFVPAEVGSGAGVFRYDTATGAFLVLLEGDGSGTRQSRPADTLGGDYARLDPATLTPWGSILTGEETTGGRLFELAPKADRLDQPFSVRWLSGVPALSHEGVRFDSNGNLYVIDEDNSGSIYKFVPARPGDLTRGQSFVLSADAFAANPSTNASESWDSATNRPFDTDRFGPARWIPVTDPTGRPVTMADPFEFVTTTGGRSAADEVKGTPYGRPEDMDIGVLASGNEVMYLNVTSENRTLSIELIDDHRAMVRVFVDYDTINLATGMDVNPMQNDPWTSPGPSTATNFNAPDNIAIGAAGEVFIVEDQNPGDIWMAVDADRDGVAEGIGLWASLGVAGSEPTGLILDPNDPTRFIVNIQHPSSGNDALWEIRIN